MKAIHNIFSVFMCALTMHTCFSVTSFAGNPINIDPINFDPPNFGPIVANVHCNAGEYIATVNGTELVPGTVFYVLFLQTMATDGGLFCWDVNDRSKNFENMHKFLNGKSGVDVISPCYRLKLADLEQIAIVLAGGTFGDGQTLEDKKVAIGGCARGELPYNEYHLSAELLKGAVNPSNITCRRCPNTGLTEASEAILNTDNTWTWEPFQTIADCKKEIFEDNTGYYKYNTTSEGCYYGGTN